ncbi:MULTISPECIES: peptidoglycan-binding domain-containing protein [Calothrix]|uniref:Peptidoglycan-binding protein n=2 Tax=Calothrix TaxID=1186 RepID=A0ABR8AEH4_9CYAN|nr:MULTISPECIES: peptidoglycan-binding protein [Calothrix]MBD2198159.1 peptidoglycan-binding protein [Calothrix parietina FACHB-288]MBD2227325.1 peptidoglycan-binding protein [Calothrix anomala FACHB-343]
MGDVDRKVARRRMFAAQKANTSSSANPSLVSPHTPTLANPVRGFGSLTNNAIQTAIADSTHQQAQSSGEESLLSPTIKPSTFARDFSRIPLHRPQGEATNGVVTPLMSNVATIQRATDNDATKKVNKDYSARFEGDRKLEKISDGTETINKGSNNIQVVKMQQALIDMGYKLPKYGVDGIFGKETQTALKEFQHDATIPETGVFDQATIAAMNAKFDTRQPYIDNAVFDPADPKKGIRNLNNRDRKAVNDALKPAQGVGGKSATFQEEVGGKKYGDEIRDRLTKVIKFLHKDLFEDKEPLRADPKKNFHDWNVLESTAEASKDVTDNLYSSYATGPKMTQAAGNFVDQWEDEVARNSALSPAEKKQKATDKVNYLIVSNCSKINADHSAVPSDTKETAILKPIVESFVDSPAKVQTMLDLDIGWEGAQLEGVVYLQRYKQATDEKNRAQLWELFHTCIHEYIHSLAHDDYQKYAQKFKNKGDDVRYNTLIEGFCDFFTENVRKTVKITNPLRQKVEGPYYDAKAPAPTINPGVYPSIAQAEQVVSIVGIRNAQAAYFQGQVKLIGDK